MNIKRYNISAAIPNPPRGPLMPTTLNIFRHSEGEWVKYKDHAAEVERLREERDAYRQAIEDYFSNSATHWPASSSQAEEVERFAVRALRAALEEAEGA